MNATGYPGSYPADDPNKVALVENCVFAGQIISNTGKENSLVGGILGGTDNQPSNIKNCLFSGSIISNDNLVGGIVGCLYKGGSEVSGCLVAGTIESTVSGKVVGTIVGQVHNAGNYVITNNYYDSSLNYSSIGKKNNAGANYTDNSAPVAHENLMGANAKDYLPNLFPAENSAWRTTAGYPVPVASATLLDEQDAFEGATVPFTINGNHISKYTIVWGESHLTALQSHEWYNEKDGIADNRAHHDNFKQLLTNADGSITEYNYETALRLQAYIEKICSVKLPIEAASTSTAQYKIVVDSVVWSGVASAELGDVDKYEIYVDGNNLVIKGGSYGATWHALDYLESLDNLILASDYKYTGSYDMITIGMVGDSITHGSNSPLYVWNADNSVSNNLNYTALAYPAQVGRLMWKDAVVYNYGQAGIRVENYRKGDEWPILQANAPKLDYVTIMLGTNDAGEEGIMKDGVWSDADEKLFFDEYKAIVDTLQGLNPNLKFMMANSPSCWQTGLRAVGIPHVLNAQEATYKELSKTHTIGFMDMHTLTAGMKDYFTDKLHPTGEGYVMIANFFADYLKSFAMSNG